MAPNVFRRILSVVRRRSRRTLLKYSAMLDESVHSAEQDGFANHRDDLHGETTGNLRTKEPYLVLDFISFAKQGISVLTVDSAYMKRCEAESRRQYLPPIRLAVTESSAASESSHDGTQSKVIPVALPKQPSPRKIMEPSSLDSTRSVVSDNSPQARKRALCSGNSMDSQSMNPREAISLYPAEETVRSEQFPRSFMRAAIQDDLNSFSGEYGGIATGSMFTSEASTYSGHAISTRASF